MVTLFRPNPEFATGLGKIADYTPRTSPRASHKTGFWTASERVFRSLIVWSRAEGGGGDMGLYSTALPKRLGECGILITTPR